MKLNRKNQLAVFAIVAVTICACGTSSRMASDNSFGGSFGTGDAKTKTVPATSPTNTNGTENNQRVAPVAVESASEIRIQNPANANAYLISNHKEQSALKASKAGFAKKAVAKLLQKSLQNATRNKAIDDFALLCLILAVILPILGVAVFENSITVHFWICLLLSLLFWLPGIVYAIVLIVNNSNT